MVPASESEFARLYMEVCDRVPWYDIFPAFLDPVRFPDGRLIEAHWFLSDEIVRFLGYLGPDQDEIMSQEDRLAACEAAQAAEKNAIRRCIRSVLAYTGCIYKERLHELLREKPGRMLWAPIVFEELLNLDLSQISEKRIGDVLSTLDVRAFELAPLFLDLFAKHGFDGIKDCYLDWFLTREDPLALVGSFVASVPRSEAKLRGTSETGSAGYISDSGR